VFVLVRMGHLPPCGSFSMSFRSIVESLDRPAAAAESNITLIGKVWLLRWAFARSIFPLFRLHRL
jgi:hypothetical protein